MVTAGDERALAEVLSEAAGMEPSKLVALGERSREIVAAFGPESFGRGLEKALEIMAAGEVC